MNAAKRIDVAVCEETVSALRRVVDQEKISLTEAVGRLVAYGSFLYQQARIEGNTVLVHRPPRPAETIEVTLR